MRDNRTGEHPNDHGGRQHKPDVLSLQSTLAQQRRDKRRLLTQAEWLARYGRAGAR